MYSLKTFLAQEPAAVKAALVALVSAAIVSGWFTISAEALAAWGTALELLLGLGYVRARTVTTSALQQVNDAQLQAIDLGRQLRRSRPLEAERADR